MTDSVHTLEKLNIASIRQEFPILHQEVNGHPLVYLDNAATNQKPRQVIDALTNYYKGYNANIHRGVHTLADKATNEFEKTRISAQKFINAPEHEEIIFTKGTSESINLVASSYGRAFIKEGDEIIISTMEHHSNIVPWQLLCEEKGAVLKVIPINDAGEIIFEAYEELLNDRTKIVSICIASNALGTINPVKNITKAAHNYGAVVLVDAAQGMSHLDIDVQDIKCDFLAASAHKMYGPTGVGILFGKRTLLEKMPPYQSGGEMIREVSFSGTTFNDIPYKFEAGTPNIADIIAFNEAFGFINSIGKNNIEAHEADLLAYGTQQLSAIDKVRLVGTAAEKVGVLSFVIDSMHHFDVGMMLDARGIAVRTGHHCTMPLMNRLDIDGTVRASFAVYNTRDEVDKLVEGIEKIINR